MSAWKLDEKLLIFCILDFSFPAEQVAWEVMSNIRRRDILLKLYKTYILLYFH